MADISKIKPLGSNTTYNIKDNSAIASITRSGTTFTATRRDGTTFTFNQDKYVHPTTTAIAAAAVKVGKDSTGHVVIGSALTKSDVGLSNVENTKLSTWTGTNNITTLGAITTGTWNGNTIDIAHGGTGATTAAGAWSNIVAPGGIITGNLQVNGNTSFTNETSIDSATINSLIVNGNTSFVQSPTAPTPTNNDSSNKLATTEFVKTSVAGLSGAMHFKGTTTTAIVDGSTTNPITIGGNSYTATAGDVVLREITTGNIFEYVWTGSTWEMLGRDTNFKVAQDTKDSGSAITNKWISRIQQNTNGEITTTIGTLDTSGTWNGNAATATTLTTGRTLKVNLASTSASTAFNGAANITDIGVSGILPIAQGGTGATSFTANSIIMSGSTTTSALTTRAVTNNTSDTAASASTNIPTMNTLYYTLAKINNADQTRATTIYAPTAGGTANTQALISNGATTAPKWVNISPSISITEGTSNAAPKINVTVLEQSGTIAQSITTASTFVYGVTKLNSATNSTSTTEAATPSAVKSAYDLADNHKYWANVEATSSASYNKTPEVSKIKLNGNTSATTASAKNVQLVYDASLETLNFVFS